jgi:uncharacterized lipoprotein
MKCSHSTALAGALLVALLAACSSEPSQSDIERAVQAQMAEVEKAMSQFGASRKLAGKVHSVRKIACTKAGENVFTCDVETDVSEGLTGARLKSTAAVRLVKASEGWKISQ